ncbi:MAG: rane protein [Frankiales bacterium]|nr:rane protein [Frankiales bacterium]
MLAVVAVVAVAAGSYWLRKDNGSPGSLASAASCPSAAASAVPSTAASVPAVAPVLLPAPGQVGLRLLNGTGRNGLARSVGDELARRGLRVIAMGNAPHPLVGASRVYYGPGARPGALLVGAHVLGSSVVPVPSAARGAVDLVLGSTFVRLRTPVEASAYSHQLVTARVPVAKPARRPQPSPTCR